MGVQDILGCQIFCDTGTSIRHIIAFITGIYRYSKSKIFSPGTGIYSNSKMFSPGVGGPAVPPDSWS